MEKLGRIIEKSYKLKLIKQLKIKKKWNSPEVTMKSKTITYHLLNGETTTVNHHHQVSNFLWKYGRPLKYYFLKMFHTVSKLKEKELEKKSKKWIIQEN